MPTSDAFKRIQANRGDVVQVTADLYDYAKGCVPPIWKQHRRGSMWAMGEINSHNGEGEPIYYWFSDFRKNCYATYGTELEAQSAFNTLVSRMDRRSKPDDRDELYKALCEIRDLIDVNPSRNTGMMREVEMIAVRVTPNHVKGAA